MTFVDVGTPPNGFQGGWESVVVRFHGFASLPSARNEEVESPEFTCVGEKWHVMIYKGGDMLSHDGMVGLCLYGTANDSIKFSFHVENAEGSILCHKIAPSHTFTSGETWGFPNFAELSSILKFLVNGSLIVFVHMRKVERSKPLPVPFTPANPFSKLMMNYFMDEESADLVFAVGNEQDTASTVAFYAHRFILKECAPMLALLAGSNVEDATPIPITDIRPNVFRHMLYYAYGGKVAEEDLKENAFDIIDAADKYEVVNLKLETEALFVSSTIITLDNVFELLLYSHDKNCALLKEATIDFIVENGDDILKKVSLKDVPGGLFSDLLTAMTRDKNNGTSNGSSDDLSTMRVNDLRKRLDEKGLCLDGSRETMIALLQENS